MKHAFAFLKLDQSTLADVTRDDTLRERIRECVTDVCEEKTELECDRTKGNLIVFVAKQTLSGSPSKQRMNALWHCIMRGCV